MLFINNANFNAGQRLPGGTHAGITVRIMILRGEHDDRSRRFGHAVNLNELGAKCCDALPQQLQRHRGRAIENIAQSAEID